MPIYTGIGSRETPSDVLDLMREIAKTMEFKRWVLRSGGAPGADSAFESGANSRYSEIFLPWKRFNGNSSPLFRPTVEAFEMASAFHPAWAKCSRGARALHARNCHQVLGLDLKTPTNLVICWTKDGLGGGGTGQALRIAKHHGILIHDLGLSEIRRLYK